MSKMIKLIPTHKGENEPKCMYVRPEEITKIEAYEKDEGKCCYITIKGYVGQYGIPWIRLNQSAESLAKQIEDATM